LRNLKGNDHAPQQVIVQQPTQQYSQQGQQGEMCKFESGQFMNVKNFRKIDELDNEFLVLER